MKTFSMPAGEPVTAVACPVCGSASSKPVFDCSSFWFTACSRCGLVFQNPRPSAAQLLKRYDDEYFRYEKTEEKQFLDLMNRGLEDISFFQLSAKRKNEGLLDIGCATGALLNSLQKKGYAVTGLEICEPAAEFGRSTRGLDIRTNTLEAERFPDERFAFVHSSHVIEHLTDPAGFAAEVARILKPGGYAVITTPNIDGAQARWYKARWRSCIADHVVLFSKRTLSRLFRQNGFEIITTKTWGGLAAGADKPFLKKILDPLAKKMGFGDVVIMLARKL